MKNKVWMVFPSNVPDDTPMMTGSLEHIEDFLKEYKVRVLIHAQHPHDRVSVRDMRHAFADHGAESCKSIYSNRAVVDSWKIGKLGCPIANIRNIAFRGTEIEPGDIIFNLDDDFIFSSGTRLYKWSSGDHYSDVIEYMRSNPRCGAVMCTGHLGGTGKGRTIYPRMGDLWATYRGLFLRRIPEMELPLVPKWSLPMRGPLEETAMVYSRIENGLFASKTMNCPTRNGATIHPSEDREDDPIHSIVLSDAYMTRFIRDRWGDQSWNYQRRKLPQGLIQLYLEAGGDPEMLRT